MKQFANLITSLLFFLLISCTKDAPDIVLTDGFDILIGENTQINSNDIEYYDKGAHLFYMNGSYIDNSALHGSKFKLFIDKELQLEGQYMDTSRCNLSGIPHLSIGERSLAPYLMYLKYNRIYNDSYFTNEDPRDNFKMEAALEKLGKLRKGLEARFYSIERMGYNHIRMTVEIKNPDTINYYYPDPAKMDIHVYHSLTMWGLLIFDQNRNQIHNNLIPTLYGYDPHRWNKRSLTLIERGETRYITIDYPKFDSIAPGTYNAFFTFPGLTHHIQWKAELEQDSGRIWLGEIELAQKITF